VTVYGEPLALKAPVLSRTSPLVMAKPGVEVVNVTGPTNPDAAASVAENVALPVVVTDPNVGDAWTMTWGVTVREKDHEPLSPYASVSEPVTVYGEPLTLSVPVLPRTSPLVMAKPGVEVVKVTGVAGPGAAASVSEYAALPATSTEPEVGAT
jgi:hypothetical protein